MSIIKIVSFILLVCVANEKIDGMFHFFKKSPTPRPIRMTVRPTQMTVRPSSAPIQRPSSSSSSSRHSQPVANDIIIESSASFHSMQPNLNQARPLRNHLLQNFVSKSSPIMKNIAIGLAGTGGTISIIEAIVPPSSVQSDQNVTTNIEHANLTSIESNKTEVKFKNPIHERSTTMRRSTQTKRPNHYGEFN